MIKKFIYPAALICCSILFGGCQSNQPRETADLEWINLFNGKDVNDWTIKISKHELGENFANTFRVEDSLLKVRYDDYDTPFNQQYGHIIYNKPYSYYLLRVVYRFVGEQAKGGEDWAWRNSGIMLHGQDPKTMLKDQDFPISLEAQLLGGNGKEDRTTGNLCTPGTEVLYKDALYSAHCLNSSSPTYAGDQWVTTEVLVLGDSLIRHIVNGDTVLSYTKPTINGGNVTNYDPKVKVDGQALKSGYFSLQSESHPIDFKTIAIIDLEPYAKDSAKLNMALKTIRDREQPK